MISLTPKEPCRNLQRKDTTKFFVVARQSTLTPLALIGTAHFAISLCTNFARYSGVVRSSETNLRPALSSFSRTAGVFMGSTVAWLSLSTMAGGVAFGRKNAFQV